MSLTLWCAGLRFIPEFVDSSTYVYIHHEVHKHKSHSRSYLKLDEKWARIKEDLCSIPDFQQHRDSLSPKSLRAKFDRMRNAVSKKCALESDKLSSSCLDEDNVSDSKSMLIEMVGEKLATKSMKEEEKNKDRIIEKQMLVHEAKCWLLSQEQDMHITSD